jgi:hypothetical protein
LTRRPKGLPERRNERLKNFEQVVLKPHNLLEQLRISPNDLPRQQVPSIYDLFAQAQMDDSLPKKSLQAIRRGDSLKDITVAECMEQEGQEWYGEKSDVPEGDLLRLRLIQEHHDTALAGHPGRKKTFDLLDRKYYWKDMQKQVDLYVRNCNSCQLSIDLEAYNVWTSSTFIRAGKTIDRYFDGFGGRITRVQRISGSLGGGG